MVILLIRHLESIKNINEHQFSSSENNEELTEDGKIQGEILSKTISEFILANSFSIKNIYCAESKRSVETANMISKVTNATVRPYVDLNSIRDSAFAGMSEVEVEEIDPEFIYQLNLCRMGLFNSFNIKHVDGNEKLIDFEMRVVRSLTEILNNNQEENLKIIILHRSSMLATLFYFVKKYYNYPKDFYGYVKIDVGKVCILETDQNKLMIKVVNKNLNLLNY